MYLLRFFLVVSPVPSMMAGTFVAAVLLAAVMLAIDPRRGAAVVLPVLVLQAFAASSGFAIPARRGHYDLLLTSGQSRLKVVLCHWAVSVLPGVAAWLAVGLAEVMVSRGSAGAVLASGSCAAVFMVSTIPWALSVGLPRFAVGVGWLVVVVGAAAILAADGRPESWFGATTAGAGLQTPEVLQASGALATLVFLIYPLVTVGAQIGATDVVYVMPGIVAAAGAFAAAVWWVAAADFPLGAAQ